MEEFLNMVEPDEMRVIVSKFEKKWIGESVSHFFFLIYILAICDRNIPGWNQYGFLDI
jgi:hypothetical protein